MQIDRRWAVAGAALAITAAMVLFAVLGSSGPRRSLAGKMADPAASGRGALLLNPHCRNLPAPDFERPPNRPTVGEFDDAPYAFAVTIPPGVTAYSGPEQPAAGFGIVLSWQPRAFLRVSASYDVFYDLSAAAVHRRDLENLRLHDRVLEESVGQDMLAGEAAERDHMRFLCPGDAQVYLHEGFIVLRNREVYRLELQTVPERYVQDKALLTAMQRSWRWVAVPKSF